MENKNRKVRLIWDFRGPDALETAKHHTIHLKEFAEIEKLPYYEVDFQQQNSHLAMAFIIIDENNLQVYKNSLKPDRGTIVN
jgi:hypothetical protein